MSVANIAAKSRKRKAKAPGVVQLKKKMRLQAKKANREEAKSMTKIEEFNANMDSLLLKFKLKLKFQLDIRECLEDLTEVLQSIPNSPEYELDDLSWLSSKVTFPIPLPCEDKGKFQFRPPSSMAIVGSHAIGLATRVTPVDLALHMPKECWYKSDLLNGRYHRKRALYLCYLAQKLRKKPLVAKMVFNFHHGNPLKPILQLQLKARNRQIWFNLLPHPPPDFFRMAKLEPGKNNIRPSWFFNGAVPEGIEETQPTPLYNHSILTDLHLCGLVGQLREVLNPLQSADRDGLLLLKHWLLTRGLDQGQGNFGGFLITVIVASLLRRGLLKVPLTRFKVLQTVFQYLSQDSWLEEGVTFGEEIDKSSWGEVVIMDPTNTFNLAANVTRAKARRVQHEAQLSLAALKSFHLGFCQDFFSTGAASFYRKFDHVIQLVNPGGQRKALDKLGLQASLMDHGGDVPAALGPRLEALLQRALGDRVLVLDRNSPSSLWWDISSPPPDPNGLPRIKFGLLLNPELYLTVMDRGPCDGTLEAKEFLQFWGSKSELRRLKDGSIREVLIWPGANLAERRLVPSHLVPYILHLQAGIPPADIEYVAAQTEATLERTIQMPPEWPSYGTGEECTLRLIQAFDSLANMLRNLGDFAQSVTNVHGLTPAFCFTQTFPSLASNNKTETKLNAVDGNCLVLKPNAKLCPVYEEALEVSFLLEGDEVWQRLTDLEALRHQKTLFYIAIGDLLQDRFNLTVQAKTTGLEVVVQGYVFRLRLLCHKERLLMEPEEAARVELEMMHRPRLVGLIQGLHQQHNTLGPAARLAKRWLASHRLLAPTLFPEVCVDLLVCHLYLQPLPFSLPCSPQVAFLRFLGLLATHNFATRPLVVNFNEEMSEEVVDEVISELMSHRANLPPLVIALPHTRDGHTWTRPHPSQNILDRVVEAACQSLQLLEHSLGTDPTSPSLTKAVFCPPASGDVIFHLNACMVPNRWVSLSRTSTSTLQVKEYKKPKEEKIPILDYDPPATLLVTLQETFEEFANFFYDCYGGFEIVMEWKPQAFVPVKFSLAKVTNRKPSQDDPQLLVPNVDAILEDLRRLSSPITQDMEIVNREPKSS